MRAKSSLALMPRPGVIDADVARRLQPRRQQVLFLSMKNVEVVGQQATELPGGDVDAQLAQLLPQQGLRDVVMVILMTNEADQRRSKMQPR
jgi:hypothetical protein